MRYCALAAVCLLGLTACGTKMIKLQEYPLDATLLPAIDVSGTVEVKNNQPDTKPETVQSYGGTTLQSTLHTITDIMATQTQEELARHGKTSAGNPKQISLKVDSLRSHYIAFFYKSTIEFDVTLGDGQTFHETVHHSSGSVIQDINGCIAEGVLNLLKDPRVVSYLHS
jgi:hypothetical protein